jgi:hypothetical protein
VSELFGDVSTMSISAQPAAHFAASAESGRTTSAGLHRAFSSLGRERQDDERRGRERHDDERRGQERHDDERRLLGLERWRDRGWRGPPLREPWLPQRRRNNNI